ncbi:Golgin subfamily A member 5, variant 2 [Balamuthia mandrillaris]
MRLPPRRSASLPSKVALFLLFLYLGLLLGPLFLFFSPCFHFDKCYIGEANGQTGQPSAASDNGSASAPLGSPSSISSSSSSSSRHRQGSSSSSRLPPAKLKSDEEIFAFLNAATPIDSNNKRDRTATTSATTTISPARPAKRGGAGGGTSNSNQRNNLQAPSPRGKRPTKKTTTPTERSLSPTKRTPSPPPSSLAEKQKQQHQKQDEVKVERKGDEEEQMAASSSAVAAPLQQQVNDTKEVDVERREAQATNVETEQEALDKEGQIGEMVPQNVTEVQDEGTSIVGNTMNKEVERQETTNKEQEGRGGLPSDAKTETEKEDHEGTEKGSEESERVKAKGNETTREPEPEEGEGEEEVEEEEQAVEEQEEKEETSDDKEDESEEASYYDSLLEENSRLAMENKLLRSEVRALNDEVSGLTERYRQLQEQFQKSRDMAHKLQLEAVEKERLLTKLKKSEDEFDAILKKKDAQNAALQVSLEDAKQELSATIQRLENNIRLLNEELQQERQQKDAMMHSHKQTVQSLNTHNQQLEEQLAVERESSLRDRTEAQSREQQLQADIAEYSKSLANSQRLLEEKTHKLQIATSQTAHLQALSESLRQELAEYKLRAQKVLRQREATILRLKRVAASQTRGTNSQRSSESGDGTVVPSSELNEGGEIVDTSSQQQSEELVDETAAVGAEASWLGDDETEQLLKLQTENEVLRLQLMDTKQLLENERKRFQAEIVEAQQQAEADLRIVEEHIQNIESSLNKERNRVKSLQMDLVQRSHEAAAAKEEHQKAMELHGEALRLKDEVISKLKQQLANSSSGSSSSSDSSQQQQQSELENSLRLMTDRMIHLQAQVETLNSERNALQMRLQSVLQKSNKDIETGVQGMRGAYSRLAGNSSAREDADTLRMRLTSSLVPQSWSTSDPQSSTHKVYAHSVNAANALDALSAKVGRILRGNPVARLFLIFYFVLLHVWALFLLSRPLEVHDTASFVSPDNGPGLPPS